MYMDNNLLRNPCMELSQGQEIYNLAQTVQWTFGGMIGESADGWEWCGDNGGQSNSYNVNLSANVGTGCPYPNCMTSVSTHVISTNLGSSNFLKQTIEGNDLAELQYGTPNAQPLTLSFWCCASIVSVNLAAGLSGNPSNDGLTNSNFRTYIIPFSTPSQAGVWKQYIFTIPGDTGQGLANWNLYGNNQAGLSLFFTTWVNTNSAINGNASFATSTPNTWVNEGPGPAGTTGVRILCTNNIQSNIVNTLNATFNITGIKLEVGTFATPLYQPSVGELLDRCQRYYEKSLNIGQVTNNLNRGNILYQYPAGGIYYCMPSGRLDQVLLGGFTQVASQEQAFLPTPAANQAVGKSVFFRVKKAFPPQMYLAYPGRSTTQFNDTTNNAAVTPTTVSSGEGGFSYSVTPSALGAINIEGHWLADTSI